MAPNGKSLDLVRMTIVAKGRLGPGPNGGIVSLNSASTPVLLPFQGKLYIYWSIDPFSNERPEVTLPTRGMQLEKDDHNRLWGVAWNGQTVMADDPRLTALVRDVDPHDTTANHLAWIADFCVEGNSILALSSVGGTAGQQVCRSPHDASPGCMRVVLSVANSPLGTNVFGNHVVPSANLPGNVIDYPRFVVDPSDHSLLFGSFLPPVGARLPDGRQLVERGVRVVPFNPKSALQQK
jgi:hypothetical protein